MKTGLAGVALIFGCCAGLPLAITAVGALGAGLFGGIAAGLLVAAAGILVVLRRGRPRA